MKNITATGSYTAPDTKEDISYSFEYPVIESVEDAVVELGEDKVKALIQRMLKVDANNIAREKVKAENGHSSRKPLTEEQKAERKAQRQADRDILERIKGLSSEQRQALGL